MFKDTPTGMTHYCTHPRSTTEDLNEPCKICLGMLQTEMKVYYQEDFNKFLKSLVGEIEKEKNGGYAWNNAITRAAEIVRSKIK